ncbi:MAG: hypothetical protein EOO27_07350 [Comamonadaceae bacterium]|nr:MAG: hypothetical protein EOO27_07350 [Comamonadaceae bacterium]
MIESEIVRHAALLAAADGKRNSQGLRSGDVAILRDRVGQPAAQDVLSMPRDPVQVALDQVPDRTLVYIMALMLYGKAEELASALPSFDDALNEAQKHFQEAGRVRTTRYVQSKPLSRYLPAGLARLSRQAESGRPYSESGRQR